MIEREKRRRDQNKSNVIKPVPVIIYISSQNEKEKQTNFKLAMSSLHPTRGFGLNVGKSSVSNIKSEHDTSNNVSSPGATILDTLKKKMNQLKEDFEKSQDELEKTRHELDEEKRRRECVITNNLN